MKNAEEEVNNSMVVNKPIFLYVCGASHNMVLEI